MRAVRVPARDPVGLRERARRSCSSSSRSAARSRVDDLELAQQVAGAARGALDRSRLFEAERRPVRLSQQLARTGSLLATELDPVAVLDAVVEEAAGLLRADAARSRRWTGDELVVTAVDRRRRGRRARQALTVDGLAGR